MEQKTLPTLYVTKKRESDIVYKPEIVGYFSLDSNRDYQGDLLQLKYIRFSENNNVKFDLDVGRTLAIKKDEDNYVYRIQFIMKWILEKIGKEPWVAPHFVSTRGVLKKCLLLPYWNEEDIKWMICASRCRGTIYVWTTDIAERDEKTDRHMQCKSWGYKFEQYMCSGEPDGAPDTAPPVNQSEELDVMVRARLNSHDLLFAAEMDGVNSQTRIENLTELASAEFVELKTMEEGADQKNSFRRFRLLNWWRQSVLTGVSHIVCGVRDEGGVVHRLQRYDIADLPKLAKGQWNCSVCLSFCDQLLHFVKDQVTEDDPSCVWCFEYKPLQRVITARRGSSEQSFLSPEFVSAVEQECHEACSEPPVTCGQVGNR